MNLEQAAATWFEHRGWKVSSCRDAAKDGGTPSLFIEVEKAKDYKAFLVQQHRRWFDPKDFVEDEHHFVIPDNKLIDPEVTLARVFAILCFNNCRCHAVYVEERFFFNVLEDGRLLINRDDIQLLNVPFRIWQFDLLPEWLQRGWPNCNVDKQGEVNKRDTWQFHPCWDVEVLKMSDHHKPLPTSVDDATFDGWRSAKWYRAWLETKDDLILPWSA